MMKKSSQKMLKQKILSQKIPSHNAFKRPSHQLLALAVLSLFGLHHSNAYSQTAEYKWWAIKVGAYKAHTTTSYTLAGGTSATPTSRYGKGITVAIVDSGVFKHTEFNGRLLKGYDVFSSSGDGTNDQNGHGTHVAGIAAAGLNNTSTGIVGIAPESWILPIRVLDRSGSGSISGIQSGVSWALNNWVKASNGVPTNKTVFNFSLGGGGGSVNLLDPVAKSGSVSIVAAGNDGRSLTLSPTYPAVHAVSSSVIGTAIIVGAVVNDTANTIASFSNTPGTNTTLQNYFLVAPGASVYSTYNNGSYATLSGTSMATPVVSGAAAVVWGAWPYLNNAQVVDSLLLSATDLGATGVDAVYGRGMLNLEKAMQPIATTCIALNNSTCGTSTSSPTTNPVLAAPTTSTKRGKGKSTAKSINMPTAAGVAAYNTAAQVVGYDSVGRHFYFSALEVLQPGGVNVANNMAAWMGNSQPVTTVKGRGAAKLSMQGNALDGSGALSFSQPTGRDSYMIMFKGSALMPFGVANSAHAAEYTANAFVGGDTLKIPYLGLVDAPLGLAVGQSLSKDFDLRLGYVAGADFHAQHLDPLAPKFGPVSSGVMVGELTTRIKNLSLTASLGHLGERGSFLGAASANTQSDGSTFFHSLSAVLDLGEGLSAMASYSGGKSSGAVDGGQLASFSTKTEAFSLGAVKRGVFGKHDQLALSLAMPFRVTSGQVVLNAGVEVNMETGAPIMGQVPVSLAPQGKEQRYELSWSTPIAKGKGSLGLTAMHRLEANHNPNAKPENLVGFHLSRSF
jgi:hypothetical protein